MGLDVNLDVWTHVGITSRIPGSLACRFSKIGTTAAVKVVIAEAFLAETFSRLRAPRADKEFQPEVPMSFR
jgi:hypothetical protein